MCQCIMIRVLIIRGFFLTMIVVKSIRLQTSIERRHEVMEHINDDSITYHLAQMLINGLLCMSIRYSVTGRPSCNRNGILKSCY